MQDWLLSCSTEINFLQKFFLVQIMLSLKCISNFENLIFLIGVPLLHNVVLVSVVQQHESATWIHRSPPSWASPPPPPPPPPPSHPSRLSQSTQLSSLCYTAASHYVTHGSVYMSMLLSQFVPPAPPPDHVQKSIPYICASVPVLQIGFINTIFLDSINMC